MEGFQRLTQRIESVIRVFVIGIAVFMLCTVLLDVFARNTTLRFRGLDELARYSLVWLVFLVTAIGARYGDLLGMNAVANALPNRIKVGMWVARRLLFLIFLALMAWYALGLVQLMLKTGRDSANLHIPLWFVYAPIMLGSILMFLSLLSDAIVRLCGKNTGPLVLDEEENAQWN